MAGELNENLIAELCAMELLSRSSYEHPDLPWAFHASLARHSTDEGRHAAIFRRLLADIGVHDGDLPAHGTNYEFAYEYPECEPGSKRELLWRLLLMCTVLEALAIDKMLTEIATRDHLGQLDFARALDYIFTDELFHAENGLKLTRQLGERFGFDTMLERELVHGRFFGRQLEVRTRYLDSDPERAAPREGHHGRPRPRRHRLRVTDRGRAAQAGVVHRRGVRAGHPLGLQPPIDSLPVLLDSPTSPPWPGLGPEGRPRPDGGCHTPCVG